MKKIIALALALVLALSLVACGTNAPATTPSTEPSSAAGAERTVLGEGKTVFYFTVQDLDGTVTSFEIHTDATTVGEALVALELISGEEGPYGLMVHAVNGITADWDTEHAYWAFFANGEYASSGVDTTDIVAGTEYSFVKTVS